MATLDGLQRRSPRRTRRPDGQDSEPREVSHRSHQSRRGSGVLLILLAFTIVALLVVRPNPSPEVTNDTAQAEQTTTPTAEQRTPTTSFSPPSSPGTTALEKLTILDQPTDRSTPQPDAEIQQAPAISTVTVRILNGGGKPGAASQLKTDLEASGYTVTAIGNARTTYAVTTIYSTDAVTEEAAALAQALGDPKPVVEENTIAAPADILIVIGQDRQ